MHKTTIKIDGSKLRSLIESTSGKTIYEVALESGYSKNVISNAVKKGYASSAVQNIARLYGIAPEAYIIKEAVKSTKEPTQISIDDIESIKRSELLELIKDAVREELLLAIDGDVIIKRGEELKELIKEALTEVLFENDVVIRNPKKKTIKIFGSEEV